MTDPVVFARLTKVDEQNRLVYGRACQEVPDPGGEIFDYETSKPLFEKWQNETLKASGGKSFGNIRAMHGNVAAGKAFEPLTFHDDERAIDLCAKVVDDNEWEKVLEGVYTGFSIGGSYAKKWDDGGKTRYTADPVEISLVDKPMIPTAQFFEVVKADGSTLQKAFKNPGDGNPAVADTSSSATADGSPKIVDPQGPEELTVEGTDGEVRELALMMRDHKMPLGKVLGIVKTALTPAEKLFADTVNKKYPLDNDSQILAAWMFSHTAEAASKYSKDELSTIHANIGKAWKDAHGSEIGEAPAEKGALQIELAKSFYKAGYLSSIITSMADFVDSVHYAAEYAEAGEDAAIVTKAKDMLADMAGLLVEYVKACGSKMELAAGLDAQLTKLKAIASEKQPEPKDDLAKTLADLKAKVDAQDEQLKRLAAAPQPPRVVLKVSAANASASKPEDEPVQISADDVVKVNGVPDMAATLIKLQHKYGGRRIQVAS